MNYETLNINEGAQFDSTIAYAEKRTHPPLSSNAFNNNDEIRIPIQQQDLCTAPSFSSLYVEGKVEVRKKTDDSLVQGSEVKFVNNGILFLFEEIRLEMAGVVVDRIRNPGLTAAMKGYATYNKNQSKALQNGGWFPHGDSTIIDKQTGRFNAVIPLSFFLGLCEDFKKILLGLRMELILNRSNSDNNALKLDDAAQTAKVHIEKIYWRMPHITVSIKEQLKLINTVKSGKELEIPFRSRELHEFPLLPQNQTHTWPIKTSIEKPQYIFFGLQTDRKNQLKKDCSRFDHCNLRNIKVYLNDDVYPYDNLHLNFATNKFALLYEMFIDFQKSFLEKDSTPIFTPEEFKEIAPIVIIDCTKQREELTNNKNPIDIRLEFETATNVPDKTSAYCLILHDRVAKYIPAHNVVSLS